MKVYVIQSKNGIMTNVGCEFKELDDRSSCKNDYMWRHSTCGFECNKACKIGEYLNIRNSSYEKVSLLN